MGTEYSRGLQHRLCDGITPTDTANPPHYSSEQVTLIQEEIASLLQKQAIQLAELLLVTDFYSDIFLVPKKDGSLRPVINVKALNTFVHLKHFKMEGIDTMKTEELADKSQPQGCILYNPNRPNSPELPQILVSREDLPLHMSTETFQPFLSTMGLHKDIETSLGCAM